jgi:hypothetical protein
VETLILGSVEGQAVEPLTRWLEIIALHKPRLQGDFTKEMAGKCLDVISSAAQDQRILQLLLATFAEYIKELHSEEQTALVRKYFALLMNQHISTRDSASKALSNIRSSLADVHEFKVGLANLLTNIEREIKTSDLLQYRSVCDAVLKESDLLGDYQFRDLTELSKRLLSQSEPSQQDFGLSIIERTPQIPGADRSEIDHLLSEIEGSSPTLKERAARLLQRTKVE